MVVVVVVVVVANEQKQLYSTILFTLVLINHREHNLQSASLTNTLSEETAEAVVFHM